MGDPPPPPLRWSRDLFDRVGVCPCPKKELEASRMTIHGGPVHLRVPGLWRRNGRKVAQRVGYLKSVSFKQVGGRENTYFKLIK